MKFVFKILLLFFFINPITIFAQRVQTSDNLSDTEKELMAEDALQVENYDKAILLYKKLLDKKPTNSKLNFLVGFCYLNTEYGKEQAIDYFEDAIFNMKENSSDNAPLETYYYLAQAYYSGNKFNKAIDVLDQVSVKIPKNESLYLLRVQNLKKSCENGLRNLQNKIVIQIDNLFDINSKYSDHSPLVNFDETEMVFTSRRAGTKTSEKKADNQYDANIYNSFNIDSSWQSPYKINTLINSSAHEAATFISADYKTMVVHRYDRSKGSLYISKIKETAEWGKLVNLGSNVNTKYSETAGSLSPDGRKLFFVSDRKGGYGGLDIYVSLKMKNGTWGPAKNLGKTINSAKDEETPFLHVNGTLFFCSKGHGSIGGFDVFASTKIDKDVWSEPVNLGIPINSVEDDFGYIPSIDGRFAYFASKRQGGKGNSDIYRVELNKNKKNYVVISGKLNNVDKNKSVSIQITDLRINRKKPFKPQYKNGKFDLILLAGRSYLIDIQVNNRIVHKIKLNLKDIGSFISMEQHIILNDIDIEAISDNNIISEEYTSKAKTATKTNIASNNGTGNNADGNDGEGKIFSIKLISSKLKLDESDFTEISDIKVHKDPDGTYNYYFGEYIYEWEAMIKLRMLKEKYPEAEIFENLYK